MTTFMDQFRRAGRNDMPGLLISAYWNGEIDEDTVRKHICHAYNSAEWPSRYVDVEVWVDVLEDTGYATDEGNNGEGEVPKPTEPTLMFRAQVGDAPGMSWTPDLKVAEWFHRRNELFKFDGERLIISQVIQPDDILAGFHGRDGLEYLVDPWVIDHFDMESRHD